MRQMCAECQALGVLPCNLIMDCFNRTTFEKPLWVTALKAKLGELILGSLGT